MPDERTQTFTRRRMIWTFSKVFHFFVLNFVRKRHLLLLRLSSMLRFWLRLFISPPCSPFYSNSSALQGEAHDAEPHVLPVFDEPRLSIIRLSNAEPTPQLVMVISVFVSIKPEEFLRVVVHLNNLPVQVQQVVRRNSDVTPPSSRAAALLPLLDAHGQQEYIETLATDVASIVLFVLRNKCLTIRQSISHATMTRRRLPSPRAHRRADEQGRQSSTTRLLSPTASCCTARRLQP